MFNFLFFFPLVVKVMTSGEGHEKKTQKLLDGPLIPPPSCFIKKQSSEQSRESAMCGGVYLNQASQQLAFAGLISLFLLNTFPT